MNLDESRYRIQPVTEESSLHDLELSWTTLLAEMPSAAIFLSWDWVTTWWHNHAPDVELYVLAAWDDSGRLAGVAPLMRSAERLGPLTLRKVSFVRSGGMLPNHMDVIAAPEEQERVCGAFLDFLRRRRQEWDLLDLDGLADGSCVRACLGRAPTYHIEREPDVCPYACLPATWEQYEREQLSANRRQQLRSRMRRLERDYPGAVTSRRVSDAAQLPAAIDILVTLNERRWHTKGLHASFDDPYFVAFQREFAQVALQRGWLRFYQLVVAGQVIATEYCFRYGEHFVNYQRGFDLAWDRYSPGQLLYAHVVREAIREAACEFDMLRGAHDYKLSWATGTRHNWHPVASAGWSGGAALVSGAAFDVALRVGRKAVPATLRNRINTYLAARKS